MDNFSIGGAWSLGYNFVTHRLPGHALFLILMGIAGPMAVEYALLGGPVDSANPTMLGANPLSSPFGPTPLLLTVMGAGFVLQAGSYFAAWRLGFGGAPAGAGLFGLAGGVIALIAVVAAYFLSSYAAQPFLAPDTLFLAILVLLLPFIFVFALFFVTQAVMIAGTVVLVMAFAMVYGAAYGQMGLAATIAGGSGSIVVLLLLLSAFLIWLAARLSCATSWMAARGSLNVFAAIAASWRMTADEQWAVTRYLALIGFVLALIIIGGSIAFGMGATNALEGGSGLPTDDLTSILLRLVLAIPLAFLTVLVPAGIYRQLSDTDETDAAEVFA